MTSEEVTFDRRNTYIGETLNQMRHGYGVYFYKNKFFRYEGDWVKGKKHGHGFLHMEDGSYYEGEFKDGEIEGHGFRKWQHNGNCYSGEFCKGEMQGHGVMNYADGTQYQGEFFQNQRHGNGILKGPGNLIYEGSWYKNRKHGQGIQEFDNGDEYEGDWVEGKRHGHGEIKYADKSVYEGQWRNDMCNGQGSIFHVSGVTYEGLWVNNVPDVEPTQVIINLEDDQTCIEILQGDRFSIQLQVVDSENNPVDCEQGREFKVSAGYKLSQSSKNLQSQSLLGLIEGIDSKPIKTPFGFDVLSYPIVKFAKDNNDSEDLGAKRVAAPSPFNSRHTTSEVIHEMKESVSEASRNGETTLDNPDELEISSSHSESKQEVSETANENDDEGSKTPFRPPPPPNQRSSRDGLVEFNDLFLPSVTDGIRPFLADDEVYSSMSSTPTGSTQSLRRGAGGGSSLSMRSEKKRSRGSRTTSAASSSSISLGADGKGGKGKSKGSDNDDKSVKSGSRSRKARENKKRTVHRKSPTKSKSVTNEEDTEELYEAFSSSMTFFHALEGDYVVIVEEVTNPPFMGKLLPPAFVIVKVNVPKKVVKKTGKRNAN